MLLYFDSVKKFESKEYKVQELNQSLGDRHKMKDDPIVQQLAISVNF
jgi:hypothetical protein